jgi:hypothetical protein
MSASALLATLLLLPALALAQHTGGYAGVDIGYSRAGIDLSDNTGTAYGAYAGIQATPNLAFELGYRDLGTFGALEADSLSLAGLWLLTANDRLAFYLKVGIARTEAEIGSFSSSRNAAIFGLGAQYDFARALFGRLGWDRYPVPGGSTTGAGNVDVFSLGAGVRF